MSSIARLLDFSSDFQMSGTRTSLRKKLKSLLDEVTEYVEKIQEEKDGLEQRFINDSVGKCNDTSKN